MDKKSLLVLITLLVSSLSLAETCPRLTEVKQNALVGWTIYDSEDGVPLSAKRKADFIKNVQKFALAEWTNTSHRQGSIHCYYQDKMGSALEAYLAKDNFIPNNTNDYWYQVSGFMQCAAGMDKCNFMEPSTRLARN